MRAQPPRKTAKDRSPISTTQYRKMKARQSAKIREIGDALRVAGYVTLNEQVAVLGISRSTAWTVLRAVHKNSGLTAAVINGMLAAPSLPPAVSKTIMEYVNEKTTGLYGHSTTTRRSFVAKLSCEALSARKLISRSRA
jgi:hypothetical protein